AINLSGVFYGMKYQIPAMIQAGGGAIVNMASILGSVGTATSAAYVAAKHGVLGLTKTAALDHARDGVRVNAIGPGYIETPLLANLDQATYQALAGLHPLGRLGRSEEVAELTLLLLSERASFITGSYHLVDGGYTAQERRARSRDLRPGPVPVVMMFLGAPGCRRSRVEPGARSGGLGEASPVVVLERLADLGLAVHHERAVADDR